jgi:hypothetical protein
MKVNSCLVFLTLALAGCQQTAGSGTFNSNVATTESKPIKLNFLTAVNPDCTPRGEIVSRVVVQPINGSVKISQSSDYPTFSSSNQRYHCNSRPVKGVVVVYTPKPGFIGSDRVVVETFFPSGNVSRVAHNVSVR